MSTLILARHAKSDWSHDLPDRQRPLNHRGNRDAPAMGKLLASYGFDPNVIVSSPATRALTTAELVAKELGHGGEIRQDERIYLSGVDALVQVIWELPAAANSAMLFGHNPDMEDVLRLLLGSKGLTPMPTCAMACLDWQGGWTEAGRIPATLRWLILPKLIRGS